MPGTVTMFETMYDAMNAAGLKPAERAAVYDACMEFSLHGKEPELEGMAKAIFMLIKPALCNSIKKKQNGSKTGANQKQNESKTEAKRKQNENKEETKENQSGSDTVSPSTSYSCSCSYSCFGEDGNDGAPAPAMRYPETVEEVQEIAARPDCAADISRETAERYLTFRLSTDWVDAAGRKIKPERVRYDLKKWAMEESNHKNRKAVKNLHEPLTIEDFE